MLGKMSWVMLFLELAGLYYSHQRRWILRVSHSLCDCFIFFFFLSCTPVCLRYLWGYYSGIEQPCPVFSQDPSVSSVPSICSWLCRFGYAFFPPTFLKSDCYPFPCSGFLFLLVAQVHGLNCASGVQWGEWVGTARAQWGPWASWELWGRH